MALNTTTSRIVYAGNGSTTQFAFPYYYLAKSHVKVLLVLADATEQPQTETTHYTLTGPSESGGTVTMLTAPAVGQKIAVYREVPLTQEFEPVEGGALPAAELERAVDKAMMCIQQLQDLISRSIVLGPATQFSNLRIPDPVPLRLLGWDSSGAALVNFTPGSDAGSVLSPLGRTLVEQTNVTAMVAVLTKAALAAEIGFSSLGLTLVEKTTAAAMAAVLTGAALAAEIGAPLGRRNLVINGSFQINQRGYVSGTATTVANQYTVDRWRVVTSGQSLTIGTYQVTAPAGGIEQVIEGASILKGDSYVLSWTGTATATVNGSAVSNGGTVTLTAGADVTIKFVDGTVGFVQLEPGTIVTPFELRPTGEELALCHRYALVLGGNSLSELFAQGQSLINNNAFASIELPTTMRIKPALTYSALSDFQLSDLLGGNYTPTSIVGSTASSPNLLVFDIGVSGTPLTVSKGYFLQAVNTSARLILSAEI